LGTGGHACVLSDILLQQDRKIIAIISPVVPTKSRVFEGIPHLLNDEDIHQFDKKNVKLVNGIGSIPGKNQRFSVYHYFKRLGYEFETIIANQAFVSNYATLGEGVQVMAGAIVQTGAIIGANSLVNTGAIIDHDCHIGANNHIAPGVTLSGHVDSEEFVHFGTGVSVTQGVRLGENAVIAAGAIITQDVEKNTICFPARITKKVLD
jgi:sugar O-acyltransferase (sialic acid O-acetyltransferase NeuD family)